jgi:preprotein translocase subunit SecF
MALSGIGGRLYRGEKSFNIVGNRRRWYALSAIFIILASAALGVKGLHLGIEFKGGSVFTITKDGATIEDGRNAIAKAGVTSETVVQKVGSNKIRIQTGALSSFDSVKASLASTFGVNEESIDTQLIGPSWGKEITKKALYGLIGFILVVMLYLALAFEPKMALSAIVAVIHDVFITVGIYALVGFDVTPATVIGFLTILGYSLYDTVVVFDKVRENTKSISTIGKSTYSQAANLAVNQTLVRSFNFSYCTASGRINSLCGGRFTWCRNAQRSLTCLICWSDCWNLFLNIYCHTNTCFTAGTRTSNGSTCKAKCESVIRFYFDFRSTK